MCCLSCISQKAIRVINFILTIVLTLSIITLLVFVAIKSNYTNFSFKWGTLLIILLSILGLSLILILVGGLSLCYNNKFCYGLFFIINISTTLVFIVLGIFCLVNSSTEKIIKTFGCETENTDLLAMYSDHDTYLHEVDKLLCSDDCVCSLYTEANYTEVDNYRESRGMYLDNTDGDYSISFSLETWKYDDSHGKPVAFDNCTAQTRALAVENFNKVRTNNETLDASFVEDLESWYSLLETHFNCVGMCETHYSVNGFNRGMNKYLFTDINRGPPEFYGCVATIAEWAPSQLLYVGLISLVLGVISFLITWMTGCVVFGKEKEKE